MNIEDQSELHSDTAPPVNCESATDNITDKPPIVRRRSRSKREAWESNRQYWLELLAEWESGHMTQAEFCAERGVKIGTFAKWRRRFREEARANGEPVDDTTRRRRRRSTEPITFVEVAPSTPRPASTTCYEIAFASGAVLRVPRDFDRDEVCRLITALVGPC
jgi:hypothetical protein